MFNKMKVLIDEKKFMILNKLSRIKEKIGDLRHKNSMIEKIALINFFRILYDRLLLKFVCFVLFKKLKLK
jgi:hypothetical protein